MGPLLRISSRDGSRRLLEILNLLDGNGLVPRTVAVRESSLDDVFLALTGHRVEGDRTGPVDGAAPSDLSTPAADRPADPMTRDGAP